MNKLQIRILKFIGLKITEIILLVFLLFVGYNVGLYLPLNLTTNSIWEKIAIAIIGIEFLIIGSFFLFAIGWLLWKWIKFNWNLAEK